MWISKKRWNEMIDRIQEVEDSTMRYIDHCFNGGETVTIENGKKIVTKGVFDALYDQVAAHLTKQKMRMKMIEENYESFKHNFESEQSRFKTEKQDHCQAIAFLLTELGEIPNEHGFPAYRGEK